jgi:cytochrome c biogenesis protein CcmG/thiol:disulfide interchange protein DsbE
MRFASNPAMSRPAQRRRIDLLVLAALSCTAPWAWAVEVGSPAPELNLPGLGADLNLASLRGKVVYLDFWASWCAPCRLSFPFMNDMLAKYQAKGLVVVAVNLDAKRESADRFLAQIPARFAVAFDAKGDSARRYEVKAMPSTFLVGRDGRVLATHRGFRDEDRKSLEALVVQAIGAP